MEAYLKSYLLIQKLIMEIFPNGNRKNQLIELFALIIREAVANDVMKSDVPYFTLLEDGTKDKKNNECVSIAARYVLDGQVHESIITMATFAELNAAYFAKETMKILKNNGINNERMLR